MQEYPIKIGEKQNNSQIIFYKNQTGFIIKVLVAELMVSLLFVWLLLQYARIINKQHQAELLEQSAKAMQDIAKQVSHDIRSPLAALNMITKDLSEIPEDRRLIIRNSTQRINDIANTLLASSQKKVPDQSFSDLQVNDLAQNHRDRSINSTLSLKAEYLPAVLDALISEKRIQYRELQNIQIELVSAQEYNQFVNLNQVEFKRVISNLINNSIEAFKDQSGKVQISLRNREESVIIEIRDNGKGIPSELIAQLGTKGFSFDKNNQQSGSGLGLYHAKNVIQMHQGQFDIQSQLGQGTVIRIILPLTAAPFWFVEKIELDHESTIVCVDDDLSIHQIWKNRLNTLLNKHTKLNYISFTSINEFKNWYQLQLTMPRQNFLFLVDYEFLGQKQNGLELIQELQIASESILVTSRYDDDQIQNRAQNAQIQIIPKTMAIEVPIQFRPVRVKLDAILIDDDTLCIHPVWQSYAKENNKSLVLFSSYDEFKKNSHLYSVETPIYIDSSLGNNIKGEIVSQDIFASGYQKIYLCTGYQPDYFPSMPWIQKILGKEPQF